MPILYVDNYRSFQDTYIPLKDVNFFVGENSTGKTSILSLIKLLSSAEFWFFATFNTEEITLGSFDELVSKGRKSFSVGFFGKNSKLFSEIGDAVYLSVIRHRGLPFVSEVAYIYNGYTVKIFLRELIRYEVRKIENDFENIPNSASFFKQWIEQVRSLKKGKRGIEISTNYPEYEFRLIRMIRRVEQEILDSGIIPRLEPEPEYKPYLISYEPSWISPIRAKPKRIYESYNVYKSSQDENTPEELRKILTPKKGESNEAHIQNIFLFGEKSGLFKRIESKRLGTGDLAPYEINIILDNQPFKICNVGYGVSQILPILVDTLTKPEHEWFLIQQPEIHLHPKAQATLGDLIYDIHVADDKNFIIETHSEYLINRFRTRIKENRSNNPSSQVLFFERTNAGNIVHPIEIHNNGKYSENQPASFSDFFIEEDLKMLGI
jgi:predicted ATP-dependent endonuclease of OLD family